MRARHTHCLKNGSECVRALGQLREAVLHEAESNDQAERNGSPASDYKSTRQLQRKSTRYLHTQYLKVQRFTYESGRGTSHRLYPGGAIQRSRSSKEGSTFPRCSCGVRYGIESLMFVLHAKIENRATQSDS